MKGIMDHPLTGFLVYVINKTRVNWMAKSDRFKEDFQQECNLFLLEWSENHPVEMTSKEKNEFCRCFLKRVSSLARSGGFKQVRSGQEGRKFKEVFFEIPINEENDEEVPMEQLQFDPREAIAINYWVEEKLNTCQKAILATNGLKKIDWFSFRAYVLGKSAREISKLTGWKPGEVEKHLADCVKRVRKQVGIDENVSMPPMPTMRGTARFGRTKYQIGQNENPGKNHGRIKIDTTSWTVLELQEQFGISKSTAFRVKARGWYTRNYHKKTESQ